MLLLVCVSTIDNDCDDAVPANRCCNRCFRDGVYCFEELFRKNRFFSDAAQILIRVFVREDHGDQCHGGHRHHVPGRSDARTGGVDQPGCDERRGSTEDGVGKVEAECEAGETNRCREGFSQVARKRTVVGGQGGAHGELNDQHRPELCGVQRHEGRNGEHDEGHACTNQHLLASEHHTGRNKSTTPSNNPAKKITKIFCNIEKDGMLTSFSIVPKTSI